MQKREKSRGTILLRRSDTLSTMITVWKTEGD